MTATPPPPEPSDEVETFTFQAGNAQILPRCLRFSWPTKLRIELFQFDDTSYFIDFSEILQLRTRIATKGGFRKKPLIITCSYDSKLRRY